MAYRKVSRTEMVDTTSAHDDNKVASYSAIDQGIYLVFGIIESLLLLRFLFRMTGANPAAGIVNGVYTITNVLMAPFRFVFGNTAVEGSVIEWSVLVAMFFYALLAWILMRLVNITYTADKAS